MHRGCRSLRVPSSARSGVVWLQNARVQGPVVWSDAVARRDLAGLHQIPGAQWDVAERDRGPARGVQALELDVGDYPADDEPPEAAQHGRWSEPDRLGEEGGPARVPVPLELVDQDHGQVQQQVPLDPGQLCPSRPTAVWGWRRTSGA